MSKCSHAYLFTAAQYWKQLNYLSLNGQTNTSCPCKAMDEVVGINKSLISAATFTNLVHYEMWKGSSTKGDIMKFPVYKISNAEINANKSRWLVIFFME